MSKMPDNCYPGYWIEKIMRSPYTPDSIKNDPVKAEKLALHLAMFNSMSPIGSNAFVPYTLRSKFNPRKEIESDE